ncbi:MAG: HAMP domain-containing sensor histidine kinase [Candidatus Thiodiazotropha sp. 6PDIVS]
MKRHHRLSGRLVLLFICVSILIIFVVHSGFRYGIRDEIRQFAEPHLVEYVDHLRQQIGTPPDIQAASALAHRLQLDIQINFPEYRWSSNGKPIDENRLSFHTHQLPNGKTVQLSHDERRFLLRLHEEDIELLFITQDNWKSGSLPIIGIVTIFTVLALIALTYHLVRRLFQPIEIIRHDVALFGSGELDHRISLQRRDELGELANSINTMADEIQGMLEAKRQLLLAISHELRSPLTRVRLNAELLSESDPRERIIADLQVLEHQLTELLETERLESKHAKLDLQPVDPTQLIESVADKHFFDARLQPHFTNVGKIIDLDLVRIKLLIRNLLENALRHTPDGARPVDIYSEVGTEGWQFTVEDYGEGIPAEHISHLTEPFYRVDQARQRYTGGYGLGLYLCRIIVDAHDGRLSIKSELEKGTKISIFIPSSR